MRFFIHLSFILNCSIMFHFSIEVWHLMVPLAFKSRVCENTLNKLLRIVFVVSYNK